MSRRIWFIALIVLLGHGNQAYAAEEAELTACGIVSAADAGKFVGAPLEVKEFAKLPTANGPGT